MLCFADDTRFLFQVKNHAQAEIAQKYINAFVREVSIVGLQINASKSVLVYYGKNNYVQDILIDNVVVPVRDHSLELGCILSNSMNFKLQLERNINKASRFIFMIRNTFTVRTYDVLEKLYFVYFIPILLYSSQIWLTEFQYMKDALYRVFRKFWRLGGGFIKPKYKVLDPYQMAIKQNLSMMYQMSKDKTCLKFDDYFHVKVGNQTRSQVKGELTIPCNKYVNRDYFFTTSMSKVYNDLPPNIKDSQSLEMFKKLLVPFLKVKAPTPPCNYIPWYKRK